MVKKKRYEFIFFLFSRCIIQIKFFSKEKTEKKKASGRQGIYKGGL